MKPERFFPVIVASIAIFISLSNVTHAYSIGTGGPVLSTSSVTIDNSFETLIAPFEAFFHSLSGSIGTQSILGTNPSNPASTPSFNFSNIQNINPQTLLQEVDQWFMDHSFTQIVAAVLGAILWVLWLAQQFIQWLLGLIH